MFIDGEKEKIVDDCDNMQKALFAYRGKVVKMSNVLSDYLEIYSRYPADAFLSKAQRKFRHNELMKWTKQEYQPMPNIGEIKDFMRINSTLRYEQPFFLKVIVPCVLRDIGNGEIESLCFLFECNGMDYHKGTTTDYVNLLCVGTNYKYMDTMEFVDLVLSHEPNNNVVLNYKYMELLCGLDFCLHEVPWAVLCERETVPEMRKRLNEFASVSKKIGKYDGGLIQRWGDIFTAWERYLDNRGGYNCFEDYLIKHKIAYQSNRRYFYSNKKTGGEG